MQYNIRITAHTLITASAWDVTCLSCIWVIIFVFPLFFLFTNLGNDWSQTCKFPLTVFHDFAHKPHRSQPHTTSETAKIKPTYAASVKRRPKLNPHKSYLRVNLQSYQLINIHHNLRSARCRRWNREAEIRGRKMSIHFHKASTELCTMKFQP